MRRQRKEHGDEVLSPVEAAAHVLAGLIAAVMIARFVVELAPAGSEYRTSLRADALLLGCLLALVPWQPTRAVAAAAAVALVMLSLASWRDDQTALGYSVVALAALVIVAAAAGAQWGSAGPLGRIGRASYGAYLWHLPLFAVLGAGLPGIFATLVVAEASFRWLEEPLRVRLRGSDDRVPRRAVEVHIVAAA